MFRNSSIGNVWTDDSIKAFILSIFLQRKGHPFLERDWLLKLSGQIQELRFFIFCQSFSGSKYWTQKKIDTYLTTQAVAINALAVSKNPRSETRFALFNVPGSVLRDVNVKEKLASKIKKR